MLNLRLSEHFDLEEFGAVPPVCVYPYTKLCEVLLEPLRIHYKQPIIITSGYRSPAENAAAHGVAHSQHEATAMYCAADFYIPSMQADLRPVFDLIRQSSGLQFDEVILEHGEVGDIIHVSWSRAFNRREALEGETANRSAYVHFDSTPEAPAG